MLCGAATSKLAGQNQQVTVEPQMSVSVDQVVWFALSRNPDILAARQKLHEAEGLLRQAGLRPNPALDVSVSNGDLLGSSGEREFAFGYSHTLELGGKREKRLEVARQNLELARDEIANRERLLSADVKIRCAQVLALVRSLQNTEELFRLTGQSLDLAKARTAAGEGAPLEQGLLQVEVNRMGSDRLLFSAQAEEALLQVKLLAGLPLEMPLQLSDSLDRRGGALDFQNAVEAALSRRPDLAAARTEERLAEAELRQAKSAATPDLVARGGYSHVQASFEQFGFSQPGGILTPLRDKDNLITGGISIAIPLSDQNQGNIEAVIARQRAARLRRESLERIVRQEVMSAVARLAASNRALQLFDAGVIGQSQENVRVVRGAYELGELRLLDVINEQRRLIETQRAYTDLLRDAYIAAVELGRATAQPVK